MIFMQCNSLGVWGCELPPGTRRLKRRVSWLPFFKYLSSSTLVSVVPPSDGQADSTPTIHYCLYLVLAVIETSVNKS